MWGSKRQQSKMGGSPNQVWGRLVRLGATRLSKQDSAREPVGKNGSLDGQRYDERLNRLTAAFRNNHDTTTKRVEEKNEGVAGAAFQRVSDQRARAQPPRIVWSGESITRRTGARRRWQATLEKKKERK
jgi:hypothetical protein